MKETWIKLCLELNFIQDEGKKCIQMHQDIENFEVMQISMHKISQMKYSTYRLSRIDRHSQWTAYECAKNFRRGLGSRQHCKLVLAWLIEQDEKRLFNCYNLRFPWF